MTPPSPPRGLTALQWKLVGMLPKIAPMNGRDAIPIAADLLHALAQQALAARALLREIVEKYDDGGGVMYVAKLLAADAAEEEKP